MSNLYHHLFAAAGERPFIEVDGSSHSYGDVDRRAGTLATVLLERGVARGDRVVAQTTKSLEALTLWLGCLRAGVVFVPTNTAYTADELGYFCSDADASLLVVDNEAAVSTVTSVPTNKATLDELVEDASRAEPVDVANVAPNQPASLVYTSGTTGRPKGATLTHGCLLDNAQALAEVWHFQPDDVLLHSLPIFHVHGLFIALNPTMLLGAQVRFLPRFDLDLVIEQLPDSSVFMGVPTYYRRLLHDDRFGTDVCRTVRLFTSGSAPMTEQTHDEFTQRTGQEIVERYGMSEAGIIASNRVGHVQPGSVGHALPGYELRVVNHQGEVLGPGQTGVVEVRGPSLCDGYWQRPDADAASRTSDGWFSTGDIGSLDATGRLVLEGRSSDMIISGGLNVYPKEIELVLDAIEGINESAVIGLAHDDLGEVVTAFVVLEPGADLDDLAVDDALEPLARFKHPKSIHVLDELPRNAMGKVQKVLLRADAGERRPTDHLAPSVDTRR